MKNPLRSLLLLIAGFSMMQVLGTISFAKEVAIGITNYGVVYDGANIWVANYPDNTVTKLRAADGALRAVYKVPGPWGMAFDGRNIWVANYSGDTVTKLRAADGALMGIYPVGVNPRAVLFDGAYIWVASGGVSGSLTRLRAADGAPVWTIPVDDPWGMAYDGKTVWVTNNRANRVTRINSAGCILGEYKAGERPMGIAFDGISLWVADNGGAELTRLSAVNGARIGEVPVGVDPFGVFSKGHFVWVARTDGVLAKLTTRGCLVGTYDAGLYPDGIAFDGANIWVADNEGAVKVFRAYSGSLVATCKIRQPCRPGAEIGALALAGPTHGKEEIVFKKNLFPKDHLPGISTDSNRSYYNARLGAISPNGE